MAELKDRLDARITDLTAQLSRLEATYLADKATIERSIATYAAVGKQVTPDLEAAVASLKKLGIVTL